MKGINTADEIGDNDENEKSEKQHEQMRSCNNLLPHHKNEKRILSVSKIYRKPISTSNAIKNFEKMKTPSS